MSILIGLICDSTGAMISSQEKVAENGEGEEDGAEGEGEGEGDDEDGDEN